MEKEIIIAISVFFIVYGLLVWDRIDRAVVAILGASSLMALGVLTQKEAILGIDFNTIGLLVGMMIIVGVCQKTGMFHYLAIKSAKFAKGEPWLILLYLAILTALFSAFLDSVTAVLLIAPITLLITDELKVTPYPFLYSQILTSNIGGTATLVGNPPIVMIGSAQGFTFMDLVINVAPVIVVILAATLAVFKIFYGKKLTVAEDMKEKIMYFREADAITDPRLLKKCLAILFLVIAGFIFHGPLNLEIATIALIGAGIIMLISKETVHTTMERVEWTTLFFFMGLFVIVQGLVGTGVIGTLAMKIETLTGGEVSTTAYYVLWLSGIASAFVDNIPFVATMIPLVDSMEPSMGGQIASLPVWWALTLGACLGGNGTIIGASSNIIVAGFASKSGYPIGFLRFMLFAFPLMLMSLLISHLYLYLRYL
ncbi:MAG: ArsB/NhaD family transporter [Thermodesulfobacteriota bacterium]